MLPEGLFTAMLLTVVAIATGGRNLAEASTTNEIAAANNSNTINKPSHPRTNLTKVTIGRMADTKTETPQHQIDQDAEHYDIYTATQGKQAHYFLTKLLEKRQRRNVQIFQDHKIQARSVQRAHIGRYATESPLPNKETPRTVAVQSQCPTKRCECQYDSRLKRAYINCRYRQLQYIPTFTSIDVRYYELTFSEQNYITEVKNLAFQNLKVERINLLKNQLTVIHPGAFNGLENDLVELQIEGNGNIQIPYDRITRLVNLRKLRFDNFVQGTISQSNYFASFPNLEVLQMFKMKSLTTIDASAFENKLPKLQHLEFVEVGFTQIPVESLNQLQSLTKLYIRESKITTIYSRSFEKLQSLQDLDLSYNKIDTLQIDAFFGISKRLKILDLGFNAIRTDSMAAFSSKTWDNLETLTLSYNSGLEHMPDNVFRYMPKLQYLNLIEINLKQISRNLLSGLTNLYALDLSWNKISSIKSGAFMHKPNMYELRLQRQFDTYGSNTPSGLAMELSPLSFDGLQNSLRRLNLEYTPLKPAQFWSALKSLPGLQDLIISKTNLHTVADFGFSTNKNLKNIELRENGITHISDAAFKGLEDTLNKVSFETNNLTTISECIFQNFTQLDYIYLTGNPLNCDCRLKWLHEFIKEKSKTAEHFNVRAFMCASPAQHKDVLLYNIPSDELTCPDGFTQDCTNLIFTTTRATTLKTTITPNSLTLAVTTVAATSVTLLWTLADETDITGFRLEYYPTATKHGSISYIPRGVVTHTVDNLQSKTFYTFCMTAETAAKVDNKELKNCRTIQTKFAFDNSDSYTGNDEDQGNNNNLIIGIVVTAVVLFLIAVVYFVVKYKLEKLKTLSLTMGNRVVYNADGRRCDEDGKIYTLENEYTEIGATKNTGKKIADEYQGSCAKSMQRQFGVDNSDVDNAYSTYQRCHPKTKNPYENDDSDDNLCDSDDVAYKQELELRHSAPSRLNVTDLVRSMPAGNSRPLPQTPMDKTKSMQRPKKGEKESPPVFVTQASVYEDGKKIVAKT